MTDNTNKTIAPTYGTPRHFWQGPLAISPLLVFLAVYLVSSLIAKDFYKVPITAGFIIASAYALIITKADGGLQGRINIFSRGAGHPNVMLMVWIFVLAGAFAYTAKAIGAIDATVNLTLSLLPGRFLYAGLFLAACFISVSIGTSVGTIVALTPIAVGIATETGGNVPFYTALIVGGAFFGDNLSFISDTTIAATRTQGCSMKDKFRVNIFIAAPAAIIATALYFVQGLAVEAMPQAQAVDFVKLIPYLLVIIMALWGVHVMVVLAAGIILNGILGWAYGCFDWIGWLGAIGTGTGSMAELIIVTLLAGGMMELIRHNGGFAYITDGLSRRIKGKRGAEAAIAGIVSLANLCTANNTIAIITTGDIAKNISDRYGLDKRKTASLLDTFSCFVQGIIPYGAQILMASGLAGISTASLMGYLYYPYILGAIAILSILLRFPRKYSR